MNNSEKYNFSDFTTENYRRILSLAKSKYLFRLFTDFDINERFIILRHDVDFSPHAAFRLARIEAEEGLKTTYFFHLHSEYYNLFELEITKLVNEILGLGHSLGLHFDTDYYDGITDKSLDSLLINEKRLLEETFGQEIRVFSFHNPTQIANQCDNREYGGMLNAYSRYFREDAGYCSDSNGYWRYRRLENVLIQASDKRLQVLLHPVWWTNEILSPKERVWCCLDGRSTKNKERYISLLKKYGRYNIDWE